MRSSTCMRTRSSHEPARPGAVGDDVLDALLNARPSGKALKPVELRNHVLGLFLAGNETTAAALSWALVHGARSPEEWAKLRDDPDRHTTAFLTESLRLTPAVWGIPRTPNKAGVTLTAGQVTTRVRRGQIGTVYLRGINRDPNTWNDPLRFDPSRHETGAKEQHRALLPFRPRPSRLHRSAPRPRRDDGGAPCARAMGRCHRRRNHHRGRELRARASAAASPATSRQSASPHLASTPRTVDPSDWSRLRVLSPRGAVPIAQRRAGSRSGRRTTLEPVQRRPGT